MIITLIFMALLFVGIVMIVVYVNSSLFDDWFAILGVIFTSLGVFGALICSISILAVHIMGDKLIHTNQMGYESLVAQVNAVNSDYEDVSKTEVISRVTEWNKSVYNSKYYSESKLTNWFYSKEVVDALEYIDMEGLKGEKK